MTKQRFVEMYHHKFGCAKVLNSLKEITAAQSMGWRLADRHSAAEPILYTEDDDTAHDYNTPVVDRE